MRVVPIRRRQMKELLRRKGWSKKVLASRLGVTPSAVYRWFIDREPCAPASILMFAWLEEARKSESVPTA